MLYLLLCDSTDCSSRSPAPLVQEMVPVLVSKRGGQGGVGGAGGVAQGGEQPWTRLRRAELWTRLKRGGGAGPGAGQTDDIAWVRMM